MLGEIKLKILQDLVNTATKDELIYMNGYLNGVVQQHSANADVTVSTSAIAKKITIIYGTETGNSKRLAIDFASKARQQNIQAKVIGMDQYRLADLQKEEILLAVVSTHGEGEPPLAAKKFYDHVHLNGFTLNNLKYGVLALGDTSYPLFCKTGEDLDLQFNKLGGQRIAELQRCDIDYEEEASAWFNDVLKNIGKQTMDAPVALPQVILPKKTGKQIHKGTILTHINLNDRGSKKETYHIEIEASGVSYECGDSLGIVPENPETEVQAIIQLTKADASKMVVFKHEEVSIYNLLRHKINIIHLTERLVKQYAEVVQQEIPATRMNLLNLLKIYPVKNVLQFEEIIGKMNAISPRLYTIASSPTAHPGEIHIVAVKDQYLVDDEKKFGLCSNFLSHLQENTEQHFFIQPNKRFRLPASQKDIIMVGPGTGIAPFRSFLAERDVTGATGRNWLFFGDQHFVSDFLYQTEIQNWYETGLLTKINLAFSRDQGEKLYVQHKMLAHAAELYEWLQGGASFFIAGKKDPMSMDVEKTLLTIIEQQGKKTSDEAIAYLEHLKATGRFEKDVY
jgi:sulfite reductase (NADPH) flavoprotein alpha-component